MDVSNLSICHWIDGVEAHKCGYCKQENCSISNGMWGERLLVSDYQRLIDRGWRRSGKYLYKPIMNQTCCPQYTIRCETSQFRLTKSQKKIVKKFNKFMQDGILKSDSADTSFGENNISESDLMPKLNKPNVDVSKIPNFLADNFERESSQTEIVPKPQERAQGSQNAQENIKNDTKSENTKTNTSESTKNSVVKRGEGADPNKPPCMKAKKMRLEKKKKKLEVEGKELIQVDPSQPKSLEEFINDIPDNSKHKLTIKLVSTSRPLNRYQVTQANEFALYKKYQTIVHNDEPQKVTMQSFVNFLVNTPLQIKNERVSSSSQNYEVVYKLFVKYQMVIHGDEIEEWDKDSYEGFLIETPLKPEPLNVDYGDDCDEVGYGSYHQQYWLDNKLIAVGVIDILPKCVSSVYFFYDPDYRSLTLGTYGSLREIEFARKLNQKYYYLGFYIHSCPKMRYKSKMSPSFLLCPETYKFVNLEDSLKKLDVKKYSRLSDDPNMEDGDSCSSSADLKRLKVLVDNRLVRFSQVNANSEAAQQIKLMGRLIGRKCIPTMLLIADL